MISFSKRMSAIVLSIILVLLSLICGSFSAYAFDESNVEVFKRILKNEKLYSQLEDKEKDSNEISTQGADEFGYLKNNLIKYGEWDYEYNTYYIGDVVYGENDYFYYAITYDVEDNEIFCGGTLLSGDIYVFLYLDSDEYDGYTVGTIVEVNGTVRGEATVNPFNYPYSLYFVAYDSYGNAETSGSYQELVNKAFEITVDECNYLMGNKLGINLGNFGFTKLFNPIFISDIVSTYTVKYDANGGTGNPSSQTKYKDKALVLSTKEPTRFGYEFLGWATSSTATIPEYLPGASYTGNDNITLYAVWEKDGSVVSYDATVKIANNTGSTTQNYRTELVLTVETTNMPEGAYVAWYYNGVKSDIYDKQCVVTCTENCLISVKMHDSNGNVLLDENGKEISDSEKINVNAGFFQRLIAFFRGLFFGNPIVYQ